MSVSEVKNDGFSKFDVVVLGAGAAGLMCAITAAERGRQVLILEKSNKVGKKILMSGGGKCNFTNRDVGVEHYISSNPKFCHSALHRYTQWDFIGLVERDDIAYEERRHGQLFCLNSAKDILKMLLDQCQVLGVEIKTNCDISKLKLVQNDTETAMSDVNSEQGSSFEVAFATTENAALETFNILTTSLVVATGALSIPTLGGSSYGYDIARQFNLTLTERRAGLVPFMFSDAMKVLCSGLSGLAIDVEVRCGQQLFRENILFTHRGLSGPAILQISNYWQQGREININLLPDVIMSEFLLTAKHSKQASENKKQLKTLLRKLLPKALVDVLEHQWWLKESEYSLANIPDKRLLEIGNNINDWRIKPAATEGYRTAEVTLGGVDTNEINPKTMAVNSQPGLYFVGEVLDVTGHLGGYNFQWAWASGFCAGRAV